MLLEGKPSRLLFDWWLVAGVDVMLYHRRLAKVVLVAREHIAVVV